MAVRWTKEVIQRVEELRRAGETNRRIAEIIYGDTDHYDAFVGMFYRLKARGKINLALNGGVDTLADCESRIVQRSRNIDLHPDEIIDIVTALHSTIDKLCTIMQEKEIQKEKSLLEVAERVHHRYSTLLQRFQGIL